MMRGMASKGIFESKSRGKERGAKSRMSQIT